MFSGITFAYVDPGLGGLLFQIGYIVFTAFVAATAFWFRPIKRLFHRKKETKEEKKENE